MNFVGIMLVKDEDQFVEQALLSALPFCDRLIVVDNNSTDGTSEIVRGLARVHGELEYHKADFTGEAHAYIEEYAGTNTWVLGVDGDEIYDAAGLAKFRASLEAGVFASWWQVFGNVLNCVAIDRERLTAKGYLSPPCRSMTKLYNFGAIESWGGECNETFLGGDIVFKDGYDASLRKPLHAETSWEDARFRCLHTCLMRRSSKDKKKGDEVYMRPNPVELQNRSPRDVLKAFLATLLGKQYGSGYKRDKYMRGALVEKDVSSFFTVKT